MKIHYNHSKALSCLATVLMALHSTNVNAFGSSLDRADIPLNRIELHRLENISRRMVEMMSVVSHASLIWPHGVRDSKGRMGIFIGSERPLFEEPGFEVETVRQAWVVFALIAAVKHSEGSQVGHIAFTDVNGMLGERWYYDMDMVTAREIHRLLIHGVILPPAAYKMITSVWQKVTVEHDLAIK
ncbi:hypothetical protein [Prosthecobacter sp.]|uniref:hypothetical protein n=1 Tax=Prosthecobacter sp. TaxID=1965333 RepID=UPI0024870EA2|nr:hypothetical protein [Prosthecobacter sp.]MDI1311829.1 hypothetical protein [Prosthecobacter sp.]